MRLSRLPSFLSLVALTCVAASTARAADAAKPNIVILYLDDMGWAQPTCYGGKLAPTPHIDAMAKEGIRFTDGYISACVCGPSRVGLMTGRYQARTGNDANNTPRPGTELDLKETTMAQRMKELGYRTSLVGKWHLGMTKPEHRPTMRGFDEFFGTVSNLGEGQGPQFYKGLEPVPDPPGAPVTSPIYSGLANKFLEENKDKPFFLYVAFNAVHAPNVASKEWLDRFNYDKAAPAERRLISYQAQIAEVDDAVGAILKKMHDLKLDEKTLVFLASDNGGAHPSAEMGGLRGHKWNVFEGGIRVTWLARWTGHIPAGQVIKEPVVQLDILPTSIAAAGGQVKPEWQLDGLNILPLMEGKTQTLNRGPMFWRFGVQHAVRDGDWKLVKASVDMKPMLVNLAKDMGETTDLSAKEPERYKAMTALFEKWDASMMPPRWEDKRWNGDEFRDEQKDRKQARPAKKGEPETPEGAPKKGGKKAKGAAAPGGNE